MKYFCFNSCGTSHKQQIYETWVNYCMKEGSSLGKVQLSKSTNQPYTCKALSCKVWTSAQARKRASEKSTLALKPRADVTRSPKQGYQWPHKKDSCPTKHLKKKSMDPLSYLYRPEVSNKNIVALQNEKIQLSISVFSLQDPQAKIPSSFPGMSTFNIYCRQLGPTSQHSIKPLRKPYRKTSHSLDIFPRSLFGLSNQSEADGSSIFTFWKVVIFDLICHLNRTMNRTQLTIRI